MRRVVWLMLVAWVGVGWAGGVWGCATGGGVTGGGADGLALAVVGRSEGVTGGPTEPGVWLVRSGEELRGLMSDGSAAARFSRRVRWGEQSVVLVGQGMQASGGYWVRVTRVGLSERGGRPWLRVGYVANRPGPDQMVTQALTQPYSAVVLDGVFGAAARVTGEASAVTGWGR